MMSDKERVVLEAMYYKVLAIEQILVGKNITTFRELEQMSHDIHEYLEKKDHASQDLPTETATNGGEQPLTHSPNKPSHKKRRRRV